MRKWLQVAGAALFVTTSYGAMSYSFAVLVTRSAAGGQFGVGAIALGFGLAALVSGVAALAAGTIADLFGCRRLLAGGSVLGAFSLLALSFCREPWQAVLVMAVLMGPAMAATFYEPVYVLMNRWFEPPERPRAYAILTLLSGFSVVIFTPVTRALVNAFEWDGAVRILALALLVVGTIVPALFRESVPDRTGMARLSPRSFATETFGGWKYATRAFWWFSGAFFVATVASSGYSFHLLSQLETRGFDETAVANAIAITGIVSLPARFLLPVLSGRLSSALLLSSCFALLGLAAWIASSAVAWWQVWLYVAVYGSVFGAIYPLRGLVTSERFGGPYFGRLIGIQALMAAFARAIGPVVISLVGTDSASYMLGFRIAGTVLVLAAVATWLAMRPPRAGPDSLASV
ncbi:MAG TPA: MFS transporter [Tepidiformaceae bacterium]|nr:MFS transporter [Tepidiformaceae bacterium]